VPFSLTHGFRPDYLLPAYGAAAMMAAWGMEVLMRRGPESGRSARAVRHLLAAAPVLIGIALVAAPLAYLLRWRLPDSWQRLLPMPAWTRPETWRVVAALVALGAGALVLSVGASLTWRLRRLAWVTVAAMLGMQYFIVHVPSRHAVRPDGEIVLAFVRQGRPILGKDPFAVAWAGTLGAELYLGRFGRMDHNGRLFAQADQLEKSDLPWLITNDWGLVAMGAAEADDRGSYECKGVGKFRTLPQQMGQVLLTSRPISDRNLGRMYLIRLQRPFRVSGRSRPSASPRED
jgi:hypothetical protein